MAINALTGRDDTLFGTAAGGAAAARLYPQWMRDARQRGIGIEQTFTPTVPGVIEIPHGPMTPANALQAGNVAQPMAPGDLVSPYAGAEGAGGVGGMNSGVSNQNAPGLLGSVFDALGLSTGNLGGSAASNTSAGNIGNDAKGGMMGEMNSLGGGGGAGDFGGAKGGDMDNGAKGGGGAMNALFKGGIVTRNRLTGPDPDGPDDGYAALNEGEGVLTAKAIKHYGKGIVALLNKLQVPKEALSKR